MGKPCLASCPKRTSNWGYLPGKPIPMGQDTPFGYVNGDKIFTNGQNYIKN